MSSALIIGSGVSGLTLAVLLAEHGWRVTVLEAHAIPGGLMQRFRRGPYWFDTGFHFITGSEPGGLYRALARRLGTLERMRFLPLEEASQFRLHLFGESIDLPVGLDASFSALARRFPAQASALTRFQGQLQHSLASNPWTARLQPGPRRAELQLGLPSESVTTTLTHCGVSGPAREILASLSAILAMHPDRCPLELYAAFAGTALAGSYRAEGGGGAIVAPLIARLTELGGILHVHRAVTRIHWEERHVTAVEDRAGKLHQADLYVSTCHPQEFLRLTGPGGLRRSLEERVRATPDSASAVLVFAGLARAPRGLGRRHHFARLAEGNELYYLAPGNFSEREDEPACLEAMVWVPCESVAAWRASTKARRPAGYEAWKREREAEILGTIVALHPELGGSIERVWSSTPLTIEHYVRSRNGAALGLAHDIGALGTEPLPHRSRLKNLLLAGQNAGHPGVLGCTISSFALAQTILGKDLCAEVAAGRGPSR
jgi:phytoene dehydrogenase-like protein